MALTEWMVWLRSQPYVLETALVLLALPVLFYLARAKWRRWRIFSALRTVPYDPDMYLLTGHIHKILRKDGHGVNLDLFVEQQQKFGWKSNVLQVGPAMFSTFSTIMCVHPDTAKEILRGAPKDIMAYHPLQPFLGEGLLVANGNKWATTRRLLTPAFHYDILKPYVSVYAEAADVLVDLWSKLPEGEAFDAYRYISLLTLDIILRCSCSHHSNCQITGTHNKYINAIYRISELHIRRYFWFLGSIDLIYMMTRDYWENRRACQCVHQFSMETIQKRRAALEEKKGRGEDILKGSKRKHLDFLDVLLEAKDESGVGMTDKEVRDEVDTFMFEGHDTTSSGISWTLYNLAKFPEHQEKCRQEVDAIFDEKEAIEWEDLKSLQYLKYCIKESMRLYPPVPVVSRTLDKDTVIDGRLIPKGVSVACSIYAVQHHPDAWENPEEFNPLRFTPENSKGRHSHAYITFSAGPRNCIGQEFALNEERVVLAHILRRFELSVDETRPPEKDTFVILRPIPLYLKLKARATH